ncbi:MAG: amino acid permease, partial [Acidobacteriota bacterium]
MGQPITTVTRPGLLRGLGLLTAAAILIGDVIGTGVFLKARVMTCNVGTPGMVVTAWLLGGLLSLAGALTYAELAAMMPRAGGEYVYLRAAYGPLAGFLCGWTRFFVASAGSQAGLAAGFAIFVNVMSTGSLDGFRVPVGGLVTVGGLQAAAIGAIVVVTLVNSAAIAFSGKVAAGFTVLKVILVLGVGLGAWTLADGSWARFALSAGHAGCQDVSGAARG